MFLEGHSINKCDPKYFNRFTYFYFFNLQLDTIMSKALLISSAGGAIWLNPFATVMLNMCSAVILECCVLYPCCVGVFGMFAVM